MLKDKRMERKMMPSLRKDNRKSLKGEHKGVAVVMIKLYLCLKRLFWLQHRKQNGSRVAQGDELRPLQLSRLEKSVTCLVLKEYGEKRMDLQETKIKSQDLVMD